MARFDERTQGCVLGHLCGAVGATIGIDAVLDRFFQNYIRLFPYGLAGILISVFMIALGARVVSENTRRKSKGPWGI
ncbi:MAG TPA: hypothetical protein VFA22_04165 [Stellaceae bacterium]|nr:hypothetical protein [Stellaceae bacterium]